MRQNGSVQAIFPDDCRRKCHGDEIGATAWASLDPAVTGHSLANWTVFVP